jgi:hypothetical protein
LVTTHAAGTVISTGAAATRIVFKRIIAKAISSGCEQRWRPVHKVKQAFESARVAEHVFAAHT